MCVNVVLVLTKSIKKGNKDDSESNSGRNRKRSFFRTIFFWRQDVNDEKLNIELNDDDYNKKLPEFGSESSCFKSAEDLCPTYSYEEIISGRIPLNQLEIDKIEVKQLNLVVIFIITIF